jgi:F420-dependent oxidoreductase-like protein
MRLGVYLSSAGPAAAVEDVRAAARLGFDSAYFSQYTGWDALTLAALSGQQVPGIDVGTAIVPTYPRHPLTLAGQALTTQAATGNRLTLGIGPSHRVLIEGQLGVSYDRPARHTREYLSALQPLLRGEEVDYEGETITARGQVDTPGTTAPSVLLAALGPVMLRTAGELADGVVTVWTGPETIDDYIRPTITRAATGRPAPRIVVSVLMSVTNDADGARQRVDDQLGYAGQLPAYRSLLDRQGKGGIAETVIAGDENVVTQGIRQYADAGATEFLVSATGTAEEQARTLELVASLRGALAAV